MRRTVLVGDIYTTLCRMRLPAQAGEKGSPNPTIAHVEPSLGSGYAFTG